MCALNFLLGIFALAGRFTVFALALVLSVFALAAVLPFLRLHFFC